MTAFTDTTAADLYNKLCATTDMVLVDHFNSAFTDYWETANIENVADRAAGSFVDNMTDIETVWFLFNSIKEGDPATLDAFATVDATKYASPLAYMQDVAASYTHNKIQGKYLDNLATYALIAATYEVADEQRRREGGYRLSANDIKTAATMAERGDATPKAVTDTLLGR